ncbi:MAG: bifunctional 3-hydroxydecanoyl-ACP dehydratase/trans-2-decenoyl-ACP isomerase [Rhizobiales bacterium]|nr:bifunctional 3-hydroxydecanoyl-ACP dehydratase/trans-2-decenoyl-ACP isomerase [Hyphomicrobiales bacterium]MBL6770895.1 bifunctional 3-hydroxydecanoyl-ACP dehydratase/trans-2-decenoyl-ACP isomerase [Hyphomicrobiales bacterium]
MSKLNKSSFTYNELIECAEGKLFGPGNAKLPMPPMLMFDKISHISQEGGIFSKGQIVAEMEIKDDLWFFDCHFQNDPVMPGCLGLDALWQLLGFYLGWLGRPGKGRALGVGEVKFFGMIDPSIQRIEYKVNIKKLVTRNLTLGVADGELYADSEKVYFAEGLKVGLFEN